MAPPSARRTNLIVGSFVLGGLALLVVTLLFVGGKGDPFTRKLLVKSRFATIGGLLEGAPVRLSGVDIGSVYSIEFSESQTEKPVIVTLQIETRGAGRLARDAKAHVRQLGLLGDKYVEIIQGNIQLGTIEEARFIEGQAPFEIAAVYGQLSQIVSNVEDASAKLGGAIDLYASPETASDVKAGVAAVRALVEAVRDGRGFLHSIIYEDAHKGILKDLSAASENLKTASNYLDGLLGEVRQGRGSLHTLIYGDEVARILAELSVTSKNLRSATDQVRTGQGLLHRALYEEGEEALGASFTEMASDLRAASGDLKQITGQLRAGKGTLGALIQDPGLYEDLRLLLGGTGRSSWLRYIIRSMVEENEQKALRDEPQ